MRAHTWRKGVFASVFYSNTPSLSVPAVSMTRLVRSRTASESSMTSNGGRSRSHTYEGSGGPAHAAAGQRGRSHTDISMESASNLAIDQALRPGEVSC